MTVLDIYKDDHTGTWCWTGIRIKNCQMGGYFDKAELIKAAYNYEDLPIPDAHRVELSDLQASRTGGGEQP
jgi:hypothetical protein